MTYDGIYRPLEAMISNSKDIFAVKAWNRELTLKSFGLQNLKDTENNTFTSLLKSCNDQILNTITELQKKLPNDHKLPYDPDFDVGKMIQHLNNAIKTSKRDRDSSPGIQNIFAYNLTSDWDEIIKLRNELCRYNEIRNEVYLKTSTFTRVNENANTKNSFAYGDISIKKQICQNTSKPTKSAIKSAFKAGDTIKSSELEKVKNKKPIRFHFIVSQSCFPQIGYTLQIRP